MGNDSNSSIIAFFFSSGSLIPEIESQEFTIQIRLNHERGGTKNERQPEKQQQHFPAS